MNSTAVAIIPSHVPQQVGRQINEMLPQVADLLPADIPLAKFQAGIWLEFMSAPRLQQAATPGSIVTACIKAAQLGYLPGRDCHIIPFKNQATMVENYQGICRRLDRTGRVAWPKAEAIYEGDHYLFDELAEVYEFQRTLGRRGSLIGFFAAIKLRNYNKPIVRVCHLDEVEKVRRSAPGGEQDAWQKWPEEMGRKTALKKLAKYLQLVDEDDDDDPGPNGGYVSDDIAQKNIADMFGDADRGHPGPVVREGGETVTHQSTVPAKKTPARASSQGSQITIVGLRDLCVQQGLSETDYWYLTAIVSGRPTDEWSTSEIQRWEREFRGHDATTLLSKARQFVISLGQQHKLSTDEVMLMCEELKKPSPTALDMQGLANLAHLIRNPLPKPKVGPEPEPAEDQDAQEEIAL